MTNVPSVKVGQMEEMGAVNLFTKSSELGSQLEETEAKMKMVVQELGCLALAVNLAGTYVSETHLKLGQYLEEYCQRRSELLSELPENLIHEYSESVLTTWEASFRAIARRSLEASRSLTILAFFHFDDIFLCLFNQTMKYDEIRNGGVEGEKTSDSGLIWKSMISPEKPLDMCVIREAFRTLESFSLVQWMSDQSSYTMHKLLHAWGYERLSRGQQMAFSFAALQLLNNVVSNSGPDPAYKIRLVPHLMVNFTILSSIYNEMDPDNATLLDLFDGIGDFLYSTGHWTEEFAIRKFRSNKLIKMYGKDGLDTISAMSKLASTFGYLGKLNEAASMQKGVLEKRKKILGEEHPHTISAMNNLRIMRETVSKEGAK